MELARLSASHCSHACESSAQQRLFPAASATSHVSNVGCLVAFANGSRFDWVMASRPSPHNDHNPIHRQIRLVFSWSRRTTNNQGRRRSPPSDTIRTSCDCFLLPHILAPGRGSSISSGGPSRRYIPLRRRLLVMRRKQRRRFSATQTMFNLDVGNTPVNTFTDHFLIFLLKKPLVPDHTTKNWDHFISPAPLGAHGFRCKYPGQLPREPFGRLSFVSRF